MCSSGLRVSRRDFWVQWGACFQEKSYKCSQKRAGHVLRFTKRTLSVDCDDFQLSKSQGGEMPMVDLLSQVYSMYTYSQGTGKAWRQVWALNHSLITESQNGGAGVLKTWSIITYHHFLFCFAD